ncbi:MAG: MBL fold metallo-hydrolase [Akkermansiaceae bacterium]|nr:MBL fold metallo-hydrolase [Akkermansiaceae bacterium]NNM28071.1 MBL fold metallo-hydrolase [Akkermansiaceae bacterium]
MGCTCAVCTSGDPRNNRTRCSLHIASPRTSALIDSGPDLREQALREGLTVVDAVVYTHAHLDHIVGFDELRAFCWHRDTPLPMHAGPKTLANLRTMFPWAFRTTYPGYIKPDPRVIDGPFAVGDLRFTPLPVEHAGIETFGFRVETPSGHSLAYISDVKSIPDATRRQMENLDVLIIDALRPGAHPTHMTIEESLATVRDLAPARTFLTHLAHDIDFAETSAKLPPGVALATDGLKFVFQRGDSCARVEPSPQ